MRRIGIARRSPTRIFTISATNCEYTPNTYRKTVTVHYRSVEQLCMVCEKNGHMDQCWLPAVYSAGMCYKHMHMYRLMAISEI